MLQEVSVNSGDLTGTVNFDFGDDLESAVTAFGPEIVFSAAKRQLVSDAGNMVRAWLKQGLSQDDIETKFVGWAPGVRLPAATRDPKTAIKSAAAKLSPEDLEAMIEELQAKLQAI